MRKYLVLLLLQMICCCNLLCQQTNDPKENGLLWEISGNGLPQSSYLFGTFHGVGISLCLDILDSIPGFYRSFDSATQYVGESNGQSNKDIMREIFGMPMMPKGMLYEDLLNESDLQYLDSVLLIYIGHKSDKISITPNYLKITLSQIITLKFLQTDSTAKCTEVMDTYLLKRAEDKKYEIKGLDTPDILRQMYKERVWGKDSIRKSLYESAEYLINYLKERLNTNIVHPDFTNVTNITKKMEEAYKKQDLWGVEKYKNESLEILKQKTSESIVNMIHDSVLKDRNQLWMQQIPDLISNQATFIGVGVGHLYGEIGLISQLREKGYTVKPVQ
jgi:uncharacterized protein YbaP (TraB family)